MKRLALLLPLLALGGCLRYRPALDCVEATLIPESEGARYATYPVTVPVGIAAAATDVFVLNPVLSTDDALYDTWYCLWRKYAWDEEFVSTCASLPLRAIATPVVFTGDWVARWFFRLPSRHEEAIDALRGKRSAEPLTERERLLAAEKAEHAAVLDRARAHLEAGEDAAARELVDGLPRNTQLVKERDILRLRLDLRGDWPPADLHRRPTWIYLDVDAARELAALGKRAETAACLALLTVLEKELVTTIYDHNVAHVDPEGTLRRTYLGLLRDLLEAEDGRVALQALRVAGALHWREARELVAEVAAGDDPEMADVAATLQAIRERRPRPVGPRVKPSNAKGDGK